MYSKLPKVSIQVHTFQRKSYYSYYDRCYLMCGLYSNETLLNAFKNIKRRILYVLNAIQTIHNEKAIEII